VALKILSAAAVANPEHKQRFILEAKTASALNHPNIVTIHEIAETEGELFIIMEYVSGKTLNQIIGNRKLTLNQALGYAVQIANGLAAAHASRDYSPGSEAREYYVE
jgi:serine/threonine protein kinase